MKLIITVVDEISNELKQNEYTSEISNKLLATLKQNHVILKPLHFNSKNHLLQKYFIIDINSEQSATGILDELWKSGAITSGYIKPKDEAPL